MKTYTIEENAKRFNTTIDQAKTFHVDNFWLIAGRSPSGADHICTCVSIQRGYKAYEDCDNCLGYGRMPVPPSELR